MDEPSKSIIFSQSQVAEGLDLWGVAFEYISLYEAMECVWLQSPKFHSSDASSTNIRQKVEKGFSDIAFERILKQHFGDSFKIILTLLTQTHGSTYIPKRISLGRDFISDERQLELIALNIVAGAIVAYQYPEIYFSEGKKAGALIQQSPSDKVTRLSKKLFEAIQEEKLLAGGLSDGLKKLALGQPIETQLCSEDKPKAKLERLIKEVTLMSEYYLTMRTKGHGRFPTAAIIEITKIVQHFPIPSTRTISPIQKKYAKKSQEEPLATKWSSI